MWTWDQSTGELRHDGALVHRGYSGHGAGRNNPAMEAVAGVGPIPAGTWTIKAPYDSKNVGPFALPLEPLGHKAHGRSAFRLHGDNKTNDASRGCIIAPLHVRKRVWASGDRTLKVLP